MRNILNKIYIIAHLPISHDHKGNKVVMVLTSPAISLDSHKFSLTIVFVSDRNVDANLGMIHVVSTLRLGDFAAGINSSTKESHSALSTHESGRPADAVIQAIQLSKFICFAMFQEDGSALT